MFGIGTTEIIVTALVAVIVLGPNRAAGLMKQIGRLLGQFTSSESKDPIRYDE